MASFFVEPKRRNVVKVAVAYAIVAWITMQVADVITQNLGLPIWFPQIVTALLILGFPLALLFAWVFELTPEGIKPTHAATSAFETRARPDLCGRVSQGRACRGCDHQPGWQAHRY